MQKNLRAQEHLPVFLHLCVRQAAKVFPADPADEKRTGQRAVSFNGTVHRHPIDQPFIVADDATPFPAMDTHSRLVRPLLSARIPDRPRSPRRGRTVPALPLRLSFSMHPLRKRFEACCYLAVALKCTVQPAGRIQPPTTRPAGTVPYLLGRGAVPVRAT